jgi:GxxExxY protein
LIHPLFEVPTGSTRTRTMMCSAARIRSLSMGRTLLHDELTHSVIGAFYEVYNTLSHGYLESIYLAALERELRMRGHRVARELSVRVIYKGEEIGTQRLDMVVDDVLIVEAKASHALHESASRQLYNYLRATNLELGLLLHFGPKAQFFRIVCEKDFKRHAGRSVSSERSV